MQLLTKLHLLVLYAGVWRLVEFIPALLIDHSDRSVVEIVKISQQNPKILQNKNGPEAAGFFLWIAAYCLR